MATTITIRDETTGGDVIHTMALDVLSERLTVRELIRSRVYQEVQDYNTKQPGLFRGLVQPSEAERAVNGFRLKKDRSIDWHQQFDAALAAFKSNRILLLVDERQAESLDEEVLVTPQSRVTFLKLVPLVGG